MSQRQIGPRPLEHHRNPVPKTDEEIDVNQTPADPCWPAAQVRPEWPLDIRYRAIAADGRHVALVEVVERLARLAFYVGFDHMRGLCAHLHRRLRHSGHRL